MKSFKNCRCCEDPSLAVLLSKRVDVDLNIALEPLLVAINQSRVAIQLDVASQVAM